MGIDKGERLVVLHRRNQRKIAKQDEDLGAWMEISAGKLADDEWVTLDLAVFEKIAQCGIAASEVVDPHGRIDKHQRLFARRG